jgi:hypothetical protein
MKQAWCRRRAKRGFGVVEVIIVLVVVLCGALLYVTVTNGAKKAQQEARQDVTKQPGEGPHSVLGKAYQKGVSPACQEHLRQLRMMLDMAKSESESGSYPASLSELSGAAQISACPIGKDPYTYDPATGKVSCGHPGHEGF